MREKWIPSHFNAGFAPPPPLTTVVARHPRPPSPSSLLRTHPARPAGHPTPTTRPSMSASGTGPHPEGESTGTGADEAAASLSTSTHACPSGTSRRAGVRGVEGCPPAGTTRADTQSPSRARRRALVVAAGSSGDLKQNGERREGSRLESTRHTAALNWACWQSGAAHPPPLPPSPILLTRLSLHDNHLPSPEPVQAAGQAVDGRDVAGGQGRRHAGVAHGRRPAQHVRARDRDGHPGQGGQATGDGHVSVWVSRVAARTRTQQARGGGGMRQG